MTTSPLTPQNNNNNNRTAKTEPTGQHVSNYLHTTATTTITTKITTSTNIQKATLKYNITIFTVVTKNKKE